MISSVKLSLVSLLLLGSVGVCLTSDSFLAVPKSAVAAIRKNVSLECVVNSTSSPPTWDFIRVSEESENPIFFSGKLATRIETRYRINNSSKGHFDLVIDSVDHVDAGSYICKSFGSKTKASVALTVLDSEPACGLNATDTVEGDTIWAWCEINSTGNLRPAIKWTKGFHNNENVPEIDAISTTVNERLTTITISRVLLQLRPEDNNMTLRGATSFTWKNGSTANVPDYVHVWSHTLNVYYGVRNIRIQPNASNVQFGDQLVCYADGNPKPNYTWTYESTNHRPIQTGSVLVLNDKAFPLGAMRVFVCTAVNTVDGELKTVNESVSILINGPRSDMWFLAVGIGVSAVVLILIIQCIVLLRTRKSTTTSDAEEAISPTPSQQKVVSGGQTVDKETEQSSKKQAQGDETTCESEVAYDHIAYCTSPPATQSDDMYHELDLPDEENHKTKCQNSQGFEATNAYETMGKRPKPDMQPERYYELKTTRKNPETDK